MSQRFFEGASHAAAYVKFRPTPPKQLGPLISRYLKEKYQGPLNLAVDVGCGSGQSSALLAEDFRKILATDISCAQIEVAKTLDHPSNIEFLTSPAEKIPAEPGSVQIITSCQACHWFDLPAFFKEADRVLCPRGLLVLVGYTFPQFIHPTKARELHEAFDIFYKVRTGPYWGPGRELVDNEYRDISLPYQDAKREDVWAEEVSISLQEFTGYQTTASGYQNYVKKHGNAAGKDVLKEFVLNCKKALENDGEPETIELTMKRKFFLLLGRKPAG